MNQGNIILKGNVHFTEVRTLMEESEIFIFTSDFNEGWGAVLNEAMSSACGCVASYKAGSTPFLLDGTNGQVYNSTQNDLNEKLKELLRTFTAREQLVLILRFGLEVSLEELQNLNE